ncbi:unnamed protein product [Soboliphyme baturini]|uniref:Rab-GAP TBC domain-containing protein n=1 Tax=Soboliphyme baturini TaxID=241478 RepID=A0A183J8D4_9BILA|nr:unnamed protein product [Soboliphyme baturini]
MEISEEACKAKRQKRALDDEPYGDESEALVVRRRDEVKELLGPEKFHRYLKCIQCWFTKIPDNRYLLAAVKLFPSEAVYPHYKFLMPFLYLCQAKNFSTGNRRANMLESTMPDWQTNDITNESTGSYWDHSFASVDVAGGSRGGFAKDLNDSLSIGHSMLSDNGLMYGMTLLRSWMNGVDYVDDAISGYITEAVMLLVKNICFGALRLIVPCYYKGASATLLPPALYDLKDSDYMVVKGIVRKLVEDVVKSVEFPLTSVHPLSNFETDVVRSDFSDSKSSGNVAADLPLPNFPVDRIRAIDLMDAVLVSVIAICCSSLITV